MKIQISTILMILLMVFTNSVNAAILTVNNISPGPGQFTSINTAIEQASNGDTILVQGTPNSYGNVYISKPITLRGAGWNPIFKQNIYSTTVEELALAGQVHDLVIEGLNLQNVYCAPPFGQYNIRIQFCQIRAEVRFWQGCHDFILENNYFSGAGTNINAGNTDSNSNLIARYNIFAGSISSFQFTSNTLFEHNLFISRASSLVYVMREINNGILFVNNIFYNSRAYAETGWNVISNCQFVNNITFIESGTNNLPTNGVNGNVVTYTGVDLQNVNPLFVKTTSPFTGFSSSDNYRLQAASPGKNAGTDGKDIGIYTDVVTFSMTGEPNIPSVRSLQILNPVITSGGTLNVKFSASKARRDGTN